MTINVVESCYAYAQTITNLEPLVYLCSSQDMKIIIFGHPICVKPSSASRHHWKSPTSPLCRNILQTYVREIAIDLDYLGLAPWSPWHTKDKGMGSGLRYLRWCFLAPCRTPCQPTGQAHKCDSTRWHRGFRSRDRSCSRHTSDQIIGESNYPWYTEYWFGDWTWVMSYVWLFSWTRSSWNI